MAGRKGTTCSNYSGSLAASGTEACPYDGGYTAIDPHTPSTIYAACSYLGGPGTLNKNILNGVPGTDGINWAATDLNGIDFADNADFIPPLVLDAMSSQNLYFGTYRLYQTTTGGTSWAAITSDLTSDGSQDFVTTISVAPSDSNTIYAGTSDGRIWQSAQALSGATDIHMVNQSNQPVRSVTAIAVDSANPAAGFVAYSGFSCPGVPGCDGLWDTFFLRTIPVLPGCRSMAICRMFRSTTSLSIPPTRADNTIYLATDSGVYASANATAGGAATWSVLQTGLPNTQVLALKLRNTSRTLVAGTHGRGLWSLLLPNLPSYSLTELSPASADTGSGSLQLAASGDGFTQQSVIDFNGAALPTTFVSSTNLTATAPAGALDCGGAVPVTVTDPTLGSTNTLTFSTVGASCDFSFGTTVPASNTVNAGGTANYQVTLNAVGNAGGAVQLSCSNAPAGFICNFSPNPAITVAAGTTVGLGITVPAAASAPIPQFRNPPAVRIAPAGLAFAGILAIFGFFTTLKKLDGPRARMVFASCCVILLLGLLEACGGSGGGSGPVPKSYQITIQGVTGNFRHSTTVQVVVD